MSPFLFNLYIDDLVRQLEEVAKQANTRLIAGYRDTAVEEDGLGRVLAYADDIALTCEEQDIDSLLDTVEKWCGDNYISVNKSKSLLMRIRVDGRTPVPVETAKRGYPIGTSYKYLGVILPDDLRF